MRVAIFQNGFGLGGTEKAASEWARLLSARPGVEQVRVVALAEGPRRREVEESGIACRIVPVSSGPSALRCAFEGCDVIHTHAPGYPHVGDALGAALLSGGPRIPVAQTNHFGCLDNPNEEAWTDFRLFNSWTSCVQAARRARRVLGPAFFKKQSVAVLPVHDPLADESARSLSEAAAELRQTLGIKPGQLLFGRFSRPDPSKWTSLGLQAFLDAHARVPSLRLLLREPPAHVAEELGRRKLAVWHTRQQSSDASPVILLRATADRAQLAASQLACDVILHTSSIGESFGYGIAEPMALGRPIIAHSVPWSDQAQIELVRHGECGLIADTRAAMVRAITFLAQNAKARDQYGRLAREHILRLADSEQSVARLEAALRCACSGSDNPRADEDLEAARVAATYLDRHQWGHSVAEAIYLRSMHSKKSFGRWRWRCMRRFSNRFTRLC